MELTGMTIRDMLDGMEKGEFTAEVLIQAHLNQIEAHNEELNAILKVSKTALDEARAIDARRAAGEELGVLAGIPIAIKDNILVKGVETTAGSQMLQGHVSSYDATVVERLKAVDAIIIGTANMDEFAMGSSNETSHHGPAKNPWDVSKVPGGSSGGPCVAVTAGMAAAGLGSDTGGSIRQPASLCGIVGMKPTYGRVSRYGLMALASSFDQIGPFTRTVEDAALVLQAIEGQDPKDATSAELSSTTVPALLEKDLKGMKLGLPKEYFSMGLDSEIQKLVMEAVEELKAAGAEIVDVSLPHTEYALATYYIIQPAEASSNLGRFDGLRYGYHSGGENLEDTYARTRGEGFGAEVKRRIMLGSYTLSAGYYDAYYRKALKVRSLIKQDFDKAFEEVDAIITPTSPTVAWDLGAKFNDPLAMYLADIFTITANLATIPGMSVPCGFVDGLPVGLQILAKPFDEHSMLRVGAAYQDRTDWHTKRPV